MRFSKGLVVLPVALVIHCCPVGIVAGEGQSGQPSPVSSTYRGPAIEGLTKGYAEFTAGRFDRAIQYYSDAIDSGVLVAKKDRADALILRGDAYRAKHEFEPGLTDFSAAIALRPGYARAYVKRGKTYRDAGMYEPAIHDFSEAIRLKPAKAELWRLRASTYLILDDLDAASSDADQAVRLEPHSAKALTTRGRIYRATRQEGLAISDFSAAVANDPNADYAFGQRGISYLRTKKYSEAIADFGHAIALNPYRADYYARRALAFARMGNRAQAVEDIERATKRDARDPYLRFLHGRVLVELGQPEQAVTEYTRALALFPRYAKAYCGRASAMQAVGRGAEALADLDQGIKLAPDDEFCAKVRGLILTGSGTAEHLPVEDDAHEPVAIEPPGSE